MEHWFVGLSGFSVTSEAMITTGLTMFGFILICFVLSESIKIIFVLFDLRIFISFRDFVIWCENLKKRKGFIYRIISQDKQKLR